MTQEHWEGIWELGRFLLIVLAVLLVSCYLLVAPGTPRYFHVRINGTCAYVWQDGGVLVASKANDPKCGGPYDVDPVTGYLVEPPCQFIPIHFVANKPYLIETKIIYKDRGDHCLVGVWEKIN